MRTAHAATCAAIIFWAFSPVLAWGQHHEQHGQDTKKPDSDPKTGGPAKGLPRCPVMDEPVDFTVKTMTNDGPVYFCCDMCIPKFRKDPQKYAEKVTVQRAALAKLYRVQVSCPVDGKIVDGKISANVGGPTIAFCSKECQAKYEKAPGDFKAKLADSYTYQTVCPISGKKIQPNIFTDLSTGQRIYFCCPDCSAKLLKDPAKYVPKLAEQGVNIDPEKVTAGAGKPKKHDHGEHEHGEHERP